MFFAFSRTIFHHFTNDTVNTDQTTPLPPGSFSHPSLWRIPSIPLSLISWLNRIGYTLSSTRDLVSQLLSAHLTLIVRNCLVSRHSDRAPIAFNARPRITTTFSLLDTHYKKLFGFTTFRSSTHCVQRETSYHNNFQLT